MKNMNLVLWPFILVAFLVAASLVQSEADPTNLFSAAIADDAATVKTLIAKGADPNEKNSQGDTAVIIGAAWGSINAVKALLEKGADINAKGNGGGTALIAAAAAGQDDTIKI